MLKFENIAAVVIGAITGGVLGLVSLLWDNADGVITFYFGFIHSKVLWDVLGLAVALLLWGFKVVDGAWVLTALAAIPAHIVVAYVTSFMLPILNGLAALVP